MPKTRVRPLAPKRNETRLEAAARLILDETEDLYHSAPRGILNGLEALARELLVIEDRL